MALEHKYEVVALEDLLKYWVNSYRLPDGTSLFSYEAFVDQGKRQVVFKLWLNTEGKP